MNLSEIAKIYAKAVEPMLDHTGYMIAKKEKGWLMQDWSDYNEEVIASAEPIIKEFCEAAKGLTPEELIEFAFENEDNKQTFKHAVRHLDKDGKIREAISAYLKSKDNNV